MPEYYANGTQRQLVTELADYLSKKLETLRVSQMIRVDPLQILNGHDEARFKPAALGHLIDGHPPARNQPTKAIDLQTDVFLLCCAMGGECTLNYFKFFGALERGTPLTASGGFGNRGIEFYDEQRLVLIGEPDYLIERIRWARHYYHTNYLLFEVAQGGASHKATVETLRRFAKHVMPAFKGG